MKRLYLISIIAVFSFVMACSPNTKRVKEKNTADSVANASKEKAKVDSVKFIGEKAHIDSVNAIKEKEKLDSLAKLEAEIKKRENTYLKIDPSELNLICNLALKSADLGPTGSPINIDGEVSEISADGKVIELKSERLTKIGNNTYILTKEYGKIKVTFNSNFTCNIWMTPKQKREIMKLIEK